ncbi:hypothetical protein LPJ73_005419 [Coemansia sp. RSA 2703]|nr:hypothetical protein LPJ73_005419 [Coemansia sp. RSA 2703]
MYAKQTAGPTAEEPLRGSGLSSKTKIIAGVCSAVGGVILLGAVFLLVRWWRKHGKVRRQRDPYKETAAQKILADDLGGASVPAFSPNRITAATTDPIVAAYEQPPAYRAEGNANVSVDPQSPLSPHPLLGADANNNEKR